MLAVHEHHFGGAVDRLDGGELVIAGNEAAIALAATDRQSGLLLALIGLLVLQVLPPGVTARLGGLQLLALALLLAALGILLRDPLLLRGLLHLLLQNIKIHLSFDSHFRPPLILQNWSCSLDLTSHNQEQKLKLNELI